MKTPTWTIVREGYFFRAVNAEAGFRSSLAASAASAGLVIRKKAGRVAEAAAAEYFLATDEIAKARRAAA